MLDYTQMRCHYLALVNFVFFNPIIENEDFSDFGGILGILVCLFRTKNKI